jgi:hypothetical protein
VQAAVALRLPLADVKTWSSEDIATALEVAGYAEGG